MTQIVARFGSVTEAFEAARATPWWTTWKDDSWSAEWCGGTRAQTEKLVTRGWSEGAREATERAARIVDRAVQSKCGMALTIELAPDVVGSVYDVGALLSGVPECWIRPNEQYARRAIKVCLNLSVSGGIGPEVMRRRGIAVTALVLALQAVGHPVTVDVISSYKHHQSNSDRCWIVRVIDAELGSQLDVDRMVYAIAHPTMFRRICALTQGKNDPISDWGNCAPRDNYPESEAYDLKFGGAHLDDAERWTDGGEAWVLAEFERQTSLG